MQHQAKDSLKIALRKTLLIQAALTGIAAAIALALKSPAFALAVLYGGAVTCTGTWLHGWRLSKIAAVDADSNPMVVSAEVFKGALYKLVAIIGLLALGMGMLRLDPLAVVIGFVTAYLGFFFVRGYAPRSRPRS